MKYSKEIKVGLLTVGAIALFVFGYQYLKGRNLLQKDRSYYAVYKNVEGLTKSAPVTINGLRVGNIDDIDFLDNSGKLIVRFHVDEAFTFSKESTAQVYSTSLIGGKALAIVPDFDSSAAMAKPGDTLSSNIDEGIQGQMMDELLPLKDKIEHLIVNSDSAISKVNRVLNPKLAKSIDRNLEELEKTMRAIRGVATNANSLLADNQEGLNRTFKNLDTTTKNFAAISDTLAQVEIAGTVKEMEAAIAKMNGVLDKVANGEGSLGKLMTDDALYVNLEKMTKQAEELVQDIKLNPKRYVHFSVFGKNPGEYDEPESRDQ
ncbi:MAG: MlaD family protein [Nonlabens sp.]